MNRWTAGVALTAGAIGLSTPQAAGQTPTDSDQDASDSHCVVEVAQDRESQQTLGCFATLAEAETFAGAASPDSLVASSAATPESIAASTITLATHFENYNGGGSSVTVVASACSATWYPTAWWAANMSSTRVGSACSWAKHYTLGSCSGDYAIADQPYPTITNFPSPVNNNVHCVKYG